MTRSGVSVCGVEEGDCWSATTHPDRRDRGSRLSSLDRHRIASRARTPSYLRTTSEQREPGRCLMIRGNALAMARSSGGSVEGGEGSEDTAHEPLGRVTQKWLGPLQLRRQPSFDFERGHRLVRVSTVRLRSLGRAVEDAPVRPCLSGSAVLLSICTHRHTPSCADLKTPS